MFTMKLLTAVCLYVSTHVLVNVHAFKVNCGVEQFMCEEDLKCIPARWRCDNDRDCADGSDEENCPTVACTEKDFNCTNSKCIPIRWKCDGQDDCGDNSDEQELTCMDHSCASDHFACANSSVCIPKTWKCDTQDDCHDGSDEQNCERLECGTDEYRCDDNHCIMLHWKCDGDADCHDGSDEKNCEATTCSPKEFRCASTNRCIPEHWSCDGDHDCKDGSDELNCTVPAKPETGSCSAGEFTCDNMECVHRSWRCDGDNDCTDSSDEKNCDGVKCHKDQFKCDGNRCLDNTWLCDGIAQCHDNFDEANCTHLCDASLEFDCFGDGSYCIDVNKHCDGKMDCTNGKDEDEAICEMANPCDNQNGGCYYKCVFNPPNHHCVCPPGFQLDTDQKSCRDVDECKLANNCSQICNNTKGYYKCDCLPGYLLVDHHHCMADGDRPHLLFANRVDLRDFHLSTNEYRVVVSDTKSAIALDFDYDDEYVYWSDVTEEVIRRSSLVHEKGIVLISEESEKLVKNSVRTPDGIAFDWLHKNVYWTDTGLDIIGVMNMHKRFQKVLIKDDLDEPRAIVVDPRTSQRWIYWTDWGKDAKLERAGLDGSQRTVIVQDSDRLVWPNGLTIDYVTDKLFWIDAKHHSINSCNLDGSKPTVHLASLDYIQHPFGISVFEDTIYWTDWDTDSIYKINKFRVDAVQLVLKAHSPMDVHVYHPLRQPTGENACGEHSHCSQLCLPSPKSAKGYTCHCNDSLVLHTDGYSCIHDGEARGTVSVATSVFVTTTVTVQPTISKNATLSTDGQHSGHIAAVVISILVILVLLAIIAYFGFRSYSRTSIKSLNFSNPVYTKTTEDMVSLEKNEFHNSSAFQPLTHETV